MPETGEPRENRQPRRAGFFLFLFFFCLYALTMRGVPTGGDAFAMFLVARSLVEDGDVFLDGESRVVLVEGRGGRPVSKFGPAQSLAEIPGYLLGRIAAGRAGAADDGYVTYFVTAFTGPLLGALACLFVFMICTGLGYTRGVSVAVTVLAGAATLLWPHSGQLFSEPLQALALAAGMWSGLESREKGGAAACLAAGFFPGLAVAAKPALILAVIPFAVYFLAGLKNKNTSKKMLSAVLFFGGLAFWAFVTLGYNWLRFGGFLESGYMTLQDRETLHGFKVPFLYGAHGLLFSSGKGLFFYMPAAILSCAALPAFLGRRRAEAWLVLGVFAAFVLTFAKWNQWHGDYTWGPRFLVPAAPLLVLPAGELFMNGVLFRRAWFGIFSVVVIAISFYVQVLGSFVNYDEYLIIAKHQAPFDISMDAERPGRLDLRDNMLNPHFVPEFSPLAGHRWILEHALKNGDLAREKLNGEMRKDFPWKGLMPYAAPQDPARAVTFDCWWYYYPRYFPASAGWVKRLVSVLVSVGILCGICVFIAAISGRARKIDS